MSKRCPVSEEERQYWEMEAAAFDEWLHTEFRAGKVYLIRLSEGQYSGLYKIGAATNWTKRKKQNEEKWGAFEIIALVKSHNVFKLEKQLHEKFSSQHVHYDLFDLSDDDVEHIKVLAEQS